MTAGDSTLDDVRRALYAGPRATFVERRKELAGAARSGGDRDGAKLIGGDAQADRSRAPREPARAGRRQQPGGARRTRGEHPHCHGEGGRSRNAVAPARPRRRAAKTVAQARKVARANGESVSGAVGDQIVQTFRAAMASDEAAAAVRAGTLTDALDEPGFGGFSIESAARAPRRKGSGSETAPPKAEVAVDRPAEDAARRRRRTPRASAPRRRRGSSPPRPWSKRPRRRLPPPRSGVTGSSGIANVRRRNWHRSTIDWPPPSRARRGRGAPGATRPPSWKLPADHHPIESSGRCSTACDDRFPTLVSERSRSWYLSNAGTSSP